MNTIQRIKYIHIAIMTTIVATLGTTSHAASLQTTVERDAQGSRLVVIQKDAHGREIDMPPPQLVGISPPSISVMAHGRVDESVTFYNYGEEPKLIELSLLDADEQLTAIEDGAKIQS
ncbi:MULTISPECIES: hypothetical protein [unclassified Moraxella]|uniref:hypothetical protein n=1 Tax=unclassified Moraxella TaxID=2685852 RepID=UPI00359E0734